MSRFFHAQGDLVTCPRLLSRDRWVAALTLFCLLATASTAWAKGGTLELTVVDAATGRPVACRLHLKNASGKVRRIARLPFWHDHVVIPGHVTLDLPRGQYQFEIERGPEYVRVSGHFAIEDNADDAKTVELKRIADMADEGWWSGDLHIHRSLKEIELLMQAEDLHVAPVITWWNDKNEWQTKRPPKDPVVRFDGNRFYQVLGGEDERAGGALLYFNLPQPLEISAAEQEYPSPMKFLLEARRQENAWIDIEKPFWWDVPVWLASDKVDSIGLLNNHLCRSEMKKDEAWGRPRDKRRYPDPLGNGKWSVDIYYHILNCGLRIPPSAGSASGVLPNPVGYNRVYVFAGSDLTYEGWWEAFRKGRVVVTNGPLLRPVVAGRLPGHVFTAEEGETLELDVTLNLATRDPIDYLEIVQNGNVVQSIRLDEFAQREGRLPPLIVKESGWFLIRAVTSISETYRYASTGPYYVEIGDQQRRISRESVQFFLDWIDERMQRIKLTDEAKRAEVLEYHEQAREFWQELLRQANAD
ncbi:MAG: CehA/McbA family metallohydrolase [Pirellulales bacterium]|nr:CehA/McbA family metallohydrolase [Pirellulales bacterium]